MNADSLSRLRSLLPANTAQLWYAPLAAGAMAIMFVRLLVYAAQMSTAEYASLSAGFLVSGLLTMLASLGLQPLAQRSLPVMLLRRRNRSAAVLLVQAILVSVALTMAGIVATLCGVPWPKLEPNTALAALTHGFAQQAFLLCTIESRSRGSAVQFAWQSLARSAVIIAFGWLAARQTHGAIGTLVAETLACAVVDVVLLRRLIARSGLQVGHAIRLAWRRLPALRWASALVMLMTGMASYLAANLDRWIASSLLDRAAFAAYSFGWIVLLAGMQAQVIINSAAFPWLARRAAVRGNASALASSAAVSLLMMTCAAIVALPGTFAARAMVGWHWPGLVASVDLIPVFAVCAVLHLGDFWSSYLLIAGHERLLLRVTVAAAALAVATWWCLFTPYSQAMTAGHMAMLPLFLTVGAYLASALASLFIARRT